MFSTNNYENEENEQKKPESEPVENFGDFDISNVFEIKPDSEAEEIKEPIANPDEVATEHYRVKPEKTEKIAEITDVVEEDDDVVFDIPVDLIDDGDFSDHVKELIAEDNEIPESTETSEPIDKIDEPIDSFEEVEQPDETVEDKMLSEHIEEMIAKDDKKELEYKTSQLEEKVTTDEFFNREFLGKKSEDQELSSVAPETEQIRINEELTSADDNEFRKTHKFDSENESLWHEAIEENTLPSFEIETVHQFRSFIKVGARILYENDELDPETPMSEDQKALVADLGQFIHAYGSFERWKEEKNRLIKEHNEAITDLKTLYKKHQDQRKRLELTLRENARLIEKYEDFEESLKTFEDLKSRNDYLESETKKFNALLGFSDLDITEEFKKRIADTKTLDISARFLHKAWKKEKLLMSSDKVVISELLKKLGEILNKPFNAGKLRLQLIELVKELERDASEKKEKYLKLNDRSFSNPLNNKELKEFIELSEYFSQFIRLFKKLSKIIESSRN